MEHSKLTQDFLEQRQSLLAYIYAMTRRLDVSEEIFQDVALAILTESAEGRRAEPFLPWAREVARRRIAEYYRKNAQQKKLMVFSDTFMNAVSHAFEENSQEAGLIGNSEALLAECMKDLGTRARTMVEKRYRDNLSVSEIAAAVGMTIGSVNVALTRTRKALAGCISGKMRGLNNA